MGGVDLLAKAEEQEKLLQESNNELEERRRRAEQLRKELEEKEVTSCICLSKTRPQASSSQSCFC